MHHAQEIRPSRPDLRKTDCPVVLWYQSRGSCLLVLSLRMRQGKDRDRLKATSRTHEVLRLSQTKTGAVYSYHQHGQEGDPHRVDEYALSVLQPYLPQLPLLWRPRHPGLRPLAQQLRSFLPGYGADVGARANYRAHRRERSLRTIQLHLGIAKRANEEPTPDKRMEGQTQRPAKAL